MSARNWYSSPLPSTASVCPSSASSETLSFVMIGVRKTPTGDSVRDVFSLDLSGAAGIRYAPEGRL